VGSLVPLKKVASRSEGVLIDNKDNWVLALPYFPCVFRQCPSLPGLSFPTGLEKKRKKDQHPLLGTVGTQSIHVVGFRPLPPPQLS
jgi:hypothetical protein